MKQMTDFEVAVIRNAITTIKHGTGAEAIVVTTYRDGVVQSFPGGANAACALDIQAKLAEAFRAEGCEMRTDNR